jgi:Ni/Co efflux regulator RcnB
MKRRTFAFAVAAASLAAAMPALAKGKDDRGEGHGHGKGHDKHEDKHDDRRDDRREEVRPGAYFDARHREEVRRYYGEHYGGRKGCPPGLAKKKNGCRPPGQARKWAVGRPLPREVVMYPVPQPVLTYLPPAPVGYRYERVGGDLVLIHVGDRLVVDIMLDLF